MLEQMLDVQRDQIAGLLSDLDDTSARVDLGRR